MKSWEFTVRGTAASRFPLDMLRYDGCHPYGSEDVSKIEQSVMRRALDVVDVEARARDALLPGVDTVEIRLVSLYHAPTAGRWRSFGWLLDPADVHEVKR